MTVDFLYILEANQGRKPNLRFLCEILCTHILEEYLKFIVVSSQIFVTDPVQIILALELFDNNFLIKSHENELLNGIFDKIIVNELPITIFADLLQDRFSQLN